MGEAWHGQYHDRVVACCTKRALRQLIASKLFAGMTDKGVAKRLMQLMEDAKRSAGSMQHRVNAVDVLVLKAARSLADKAPFNLCEQAGNSSSHRVTDRGGYQQFTTSLGRAGR